jgi:V/A-type H+-transporting ATPase subunit E
MNDQLQELLSKVYEEGVVKANAEAEKILDKAKADADAVLKKANADAEAKLSEAEKQAAELKKNTEGDLRMASNHTLTALKQKITDLVLLQSVDAGSKASFNDPQFVQEIIKQALSAWKESGADLSLAKNLEGKLDEAFLSSLKQNFAGKLIIDFSPQIKAGFSISPLDGNYKLSFSDDDFANLFKNYLRPRSAKILFDS